MSSTYTTLKLCRIKGAAWHYPINLMTPRRDSSSRGKGEVKNRTGTTKHTGVLLTQRVPCRKI